MSGKDTGITSMFFGGRQLQRALRRYDLDVSNEEHARQQMERFARRRLQRYLQQQQQQQQGGRVVLPSEYFGADSGRYSPVAAGTDMSATAAVARPELPLNLVGGSSALPRYITQSAVREECARLGRRGNCQRGGSAKLDGAAFNSSAVMSGGAAFREITDRLNRDIDSVFSRVRQQFGRNQRHLSQARLQETLRSDFM